jgi:MFS family permease
VRLDRDAIVAGPGFNRWLVPPAALAVHLSIGQAYAYSVFKLPLTRLIGVTAPAPGDWSQTQIALVFTVFIVVLGLSAALFGRWVETAGPRKAGLAAACCWGGGYVVAALGVATHRLWLVYLGNGLIGGCGLGLGYISPVSTLLKWFPDRRGLATGMAIMGFGGGALIGAPLADLLMRRFATPATPGVWQTFVAMGMLYFVAMACGALGYRLPPPGFRPPTPAAGEGPAWPGVRAADRSAAAGGAGEGDMVAPRDVHVSEAWRTPSFGFLWVVLCANVSAGIGLLEQASPMIQEVFKGRVTASAAAGFVGLLSLFNIAGRIGWASLSDRIGRRVTYGLFFACGIVLYGSLPFASQAGSVTLFVALVCLILTMYGGGFATIPAYLADLFGTQFVGAIHGRLLTAWSVAGVLGPLLVNVIRQSRIDAGASPADAYNTTMWVLGGLLVAGFVCNLLVRMPVDVPAAAATRAGPSTTQSVSAAAPPATQASAWQPMLALAWALVALPFLWGVLQTLGKASLLFR